MLANQRVTQPCPTLMASASYAGRIYRCRETHSLPDFLSFLPCPDHFFMRVQEVGWIQLGQKHLLTIPIVLWNCFRDTRQQSTQAQHTAELRAWEICQAHVLALSWPTSLPLEAQALSPHRSGDLLLPDLPTGLVLYLKDALSSFLRLPPPLNRFPLEKVCITDRYSFQSGLGNF